VLQNEKTDAGCLQAELGLGGGAMSDLEIANWENSAAQFSGKIHVGQCDETQSSGNKKNHE
jgi:hypothetical protein